jgi:malate dehydrogenase (oxaloacetate-decarboxylating)
MVADGLSEGEARKRFFLVDRQGLLVEGLRGILPFQERFVQARSAVADWRLQNPDRIDLLDVVRNAKPTVLIGVSGQPGEFTQEVVRAMAQGTARPVIFPLSNPTSRCEATPADLMDWTDGRAVIGTGSPFPPLPGKGRPRAVDQTNNAYVFPGLGLGAIAAQARRVSDGMLWRRRALADASPARHDADASAAAGRRPAPGFPGRCGRGRAAGAGGGSRAGDHRKALEARIQAGCGRRSIDRWEAVANGEWR